jgi:hypothetical protein
VTIWADGDPTAADAAFVIAEDVGADPADDETQVA